MRFCVTVTCGRRYLAVACLSVLVLLAALVYVAVFCRVGAAVSNRVVSPLIALASALALLAVGALPFLSAAILASRNDVYDLAALHGASMKFFAAQMAGQPTLPLVAQLDWSPPKQASDQSVINDQTGRSLSGGWYTGPGLTKARLLFTTLAVATVHILLAATAAHLRIARADVAAGCFAHLRTPSTTELAPGNVPARCLTRGACGCR